MDGPNENLKFLKDLKAFVKCDERDATILHFRTSGLNTINYVFKSAFTDINWNIVQYLRDL